ncbi:hypothetical protein GCM10012280_52510 [Wenjunlia tyrosinilytica]|uniref:Uncharacterized protein n=1 Tax=Wenjunlia tyrosinilytica TaxID=1544741 RepID=A0A918E171_9ACTN|nr:hypothetical protein GCM10012280_52510 [Wenjunlia tyrosinilytica]
MRPGSSRSAAPIPCGQYKGKGLIGGRKGVTVPLDQGTSADLGDVRGAFGEGGVAERRDGARVGVHGKPRRRAPSTARAFRFRP